MFKISVWHGNLSEDYLRFVTQLGVDCLDFGQGDFFPGVKEQGYPDLDALLKIKKKVRSWGLDINRVTLPDMTERFMKGEDGGEIELENTSNVRVNSLNPGATRTGMRAAAYPAEDPATLVTPDDIMASYLYLMGDDSANVNGEALSAQ